MALSFTYDDNGQPVPQGTPQELTQFYMSQGFPQPVAAYYANPTPETESAKNSYIAANGTGYLHPNTGGFFDAVKEALPGTLAVLGAAGAGGAFSGMFGGPATDFNTLTGADMGVDAGAFSGITPGGMPAPGIDQIGSDWATGQATGSPGGMLPTDANGMTLENMGAASGVPGAVNSGLGGPLDAAASQGLLQKILSGQGTSSDLLKLLGPAMSIGSGIYGMGLAKDLTGQTRTDTNAALALLPGGSGGNPAVGGVNGVGGTAERSAAIAAADPWSASGGRALADTQLQTLMRDPSQVAATDPAYQLRIQGAQRAMGSYGQGSGNMAVAGADASTSWLNDRQTALANLENMGNPVGAQQVGIGVGQLGIQSGQLGVAQANTGLDAARINLVAGQGANSLAGQNLASIAYGATRATGGDTFNPQQLAQIKQLLQSLGASA